MTTLEDGLNEADETYTLTLTSVTGPDGVSLGTSSATGTIEDDDPVSAALGTYTENVAEGDDATYEVDLSGGTSTAAVVVNYAVDTSSTATSGTDYTAPSGKLTIAAEGTSGTITIATLDNDGVLDPGETLVVKLMSASTDTRTVTVDDTATATTTILEEDMVTVSVAAVMVADDALTQDVNEADDKSKVEEGETASFVVSLTGAVSGVVQVPYTTANVTAESGSDKDYTTASGTLEFQAGDTSKTIEVTTLEDSLNEADETFTVTLTGVTGPAGVSLGTSSATGTIEDDDPVSAALGTHTANVAEGDDATYEVDLSGGTSTAPVVVNYAVDTSSTAASGTDYTAPSGKLTITAGESSGTITIATLDNDGVLDPGETLVVKLMSASTDTRTVTVDDTATATTTILEEDKVTVSVAAVMVADDDKSDVEEGETASFVVTLSGTVSGVVQVPYTTANVTAESGSDKDYTTTSGTLEFQAGDTSKTIEVTTLEDSLNEADETFTVTLTGVTGPAGVSLGTSSATGTIEDDDPVSAALGTHTANVAEGDDATYEVNLTGGTSTAEVVVNYAVDTSSTATTGTDYTAPSGKLTIAAEGTSGTITIVTLDNDGVLDPGETLVVKLMSASTDTRTVTVDDTEKLTTTILEQDMVTVSVAAVMVADDPLTQDVNEADDKSDVEEGETASFVVALTGAVSGVVQVPYTTANGTAESGSDKDYTAASGTLEFQAGDSSKTIEVTTLEDGLNEADETYTLTLTSVTGPDGVSLGTSSATGTIEDDDPVSAALGTYTEEVAEGDDATYEVNLTGGTSTAEVVVNYAMDTSSTATTGTDYTAPSGKLTIAAEGTSGTITIVTLDNDGVLDPGETLVVKLMSASTDTRTVTVDDTATATTTILEEDKVTVSVADDDKSDVEEGETASFVVTLSGTVSGVVQVPYTTANVTAESGSDKDYTAASGTLEFQAGDSSKTIEVTTLEDGLNEADETYTLTLTSVTGPDGVSLGTSSATGTIEDDDPVSAALGTHTANVAEGDDATYEVDLSGGTSTAPVVVNYAVDTSSTAASGTDYTAPSGKLTITAGESSGTITIATLDNDGVLDPGETLVVKLMSASTDTRTVTVDDTATATTTILEEDKVTVSVADDDKSDVEEGETASFVVTLSGTVSGVVQVPYTTANVTAESGSDKDYTAASGTLEFSAGDTSKTIEVTTLEDGLNEADETYTLTLTSVTGPDGVSLGTSSATGTIEDDDPVSAALGTYTEEVAEGDDATYEVNLTGGTSTAEVVVNYAMDTSSTATTGTDYTAPSGKLTITAGESSGTITIATLDNDGVLDPGETLVVKLMSASTDTRTVTVDDTATKTTMINDTGSVMVSLKAHTTGVEDSETKSNVQEGHSVKSEDSVEEDQEATSVEEGDTAEFIVELSGLVASTVTVTYGTADGTAESGTNKDYTEASGTLEFQAGDTSKTIEVTTLEDGLNEADETYTLTLTSVTGPDGVSLGTSSATGTIEDDDPVSAALGTYTEEVAEGDDATYEVNLTGGTSTAEVVVNYAVDGSSTATSGTDYTAPSGKLTIAAEGTSGTITIATLDNDGVLDPGETLVVNLTSASTDTRTVTVDDTATTTTILEEDMVTVSLAAVMVAGDDKSEVEEGETANFVVTLSGTVSGVVQVPYTTTNVTAESGSDKDYTAASGTLEFQAGDTSKTIEVTTLEDSLNEAAETFTLTLTSVTGPDGVSLGTSSATGTIEDDDPISAALGTTYTENVAEGDDATYEVTLSGGTSTAEVVVNYAMDGSSTATSGTDYTAPSGTLTIAAEGTSGTITIATLDNDGVLDPGETLVVKLTSASTATRTVAVDDTATKTTTITDSGMVKVSVEDATASEGDAVGFVVELTGPVAGAVELSYATGDADDTADSGAGNDYTAATGTLEFSAGDTSQTIAVTTLEDVVDEENETFTLTLTASNLPSGVSLDDAEATGTITDDDTVPGVPTGVSAKGANRQVTLQWSAPSSPGTSPITGYEYRSKSGTDDYPATWESAGGATATSTTVSNLANDIQHTFALRAVSDAGDGKAVEITATPFWANVVPTFTSTATPSVAENVKLAVTLQATDDDGDAVVGFAITGGADSDMFAIDDSGGLLFETAPNFEDPKDVASTDPVNAADNSEYVVVVTVTSGAGDRAQTAEQTITVTVTDADEPPLAPGKPEVDTVSITSLRARWLAPTNTGPPITDYDYRYRIKTPQGEWATFENTPITVLEQAITDLQENTEYQVQVRANNEEGEGAWSESGEGETEANAAPHFTSSAAFEIAENSTAAVGGVTADDTDTEDDVEAYAIVGGADKLLFAIDVNGALSFKSAPNHEAPQDELSTTPPNDAGNNEYVVVVMAVSGENEREKSAKQTTVVTVTDVDEPPLTPDAPTVVPASPTSLTVTWSDKTDVNRPAATEYHYRHSVKGQDDDWTEVTGHTSTSVTITGLTKETDYEVQVKAESDEGTSDWSDSGEGRTPEMPVVTLVLDPDSIAEGGASTVTATVAPAADAAFAIEVSAEADSGNDADVFGLSTNVTLQFAANETASTGTVTISAVDNAVDEDDKTVTVSGTVLAGAEVFAPADQTLTITDDDVLATVTALKSTQCDTDSDPSACVEEGNDALFPVTLTGGTTTAAVVIGYEVSSEDATVDVDYTAPSDGLLTIAQGESTGTITVETNGDDDILDPGETLKVTLTSGSTTAGGVQVSETAATMTIADTGEVNLSVADAEAAEGDVVNFAVKLTRKVASGVTFSYQTTNETAESGTGKDYTASSGTLTFAADAKIMTVAVTTVEDALDESDETFTLTVTAPNLPANVTLTDDVATGTIQDDDTRGVTVSTDAVTVVKGGDSESYTLRLRSQPTGDVTININGPGGGVLVSPTQVTFTPQNWSTTKSVQVSATTDAQADTTARITHSVSGADYAGQTANHVTVTIQEQTSVGLDLRPKSNTGTSGTAGATGDSGVYAEGETIPFFLKRTSSSQEKVTVMVTLRQDGDYMTGDIPTSVTLLPHEKEKDIPIPTEDDAIVEPDGSVTITIACDCAVTTGTLTVDVLNNDAEFAVDNAEAVESEGHITFTVEITGTLQVDMDLNYETTKGGSATAGKDYEKPDDSALVTVPAGKRTATISIPVLDDTLVEGDEWFGMRVFHTVDPDMDRSARGTIRDDDAAVAKAWLARFGRTVASHVVEAVDARLTGNWVRRRK